MGWFQEYWCRELEKRASILPNADSLYNSATVPHATRWRLPLPSFADTIAYRDAVLARLERELDRSMPTSSSWRCATSSCTRGFSLHAPDARLSGPDAPPRVLVGEGDGVRRRLFRLGATRDGSFAFDNEKWSHPVVLEPFRISRRPVTYGEYRRFREPLYCKDGRVRASTAGYRSATTSRCGT